MQELTLPARAIVNATPRTRAIQIDLGSHTFPFTAGQAVFAGLESGSVRRPYSIACSPGQAQRNNAIELLVQIDDYEAPDPHLELTQPGTLLRVQGPFGSFVLPRDAAHAPLLFIAGGTGIAPLRSMIWDVLDKRDDSAIGVLYSARHPEEFAYADELKGLAAHGRIQLLRTVTRDSRSDWDGVRGRMTPELISGMLDPEKAYSLICGPASLVADASSILRALGVPDNRILTETYASSNP